MTNCYILCGENGHAAVIDPAFYPEKIKQAIEAEGLILEKILLTHAHFDHIMAAEELRKCGAKVYVHEYDDEMYIDPLKNSMIEFTGKNVPFERADVLLSDGDTVELDGEELHVIHTPGHTKGSVCYKTDGVIFTGDTLFCGSIGRWDLYGGSREMLMSSLKKLAKLSGNYTVLSGHGESTTLEQEKNDNIYMKL